MRNVNGINVKLQAHRGVSTDFPENTMAAFRAAVAQGYDVIELDPKFTADDQCVVLHDRTLARTGRRSDGTAIEGDIKIADITYAEALEFDYGVWHSEEFCGEKLPLLEEALVYAAANGIPVKIDNVIESFTEEQTEMLFRIVERTGAQHIAGFTCTRADYAAKVASRFPDSMIHYDGPVDEARLSEIYAIIRDNPVTVWLPFPNRLTAWCKMPAVSEERAAMVRGFGAQLGVWILEDEEDLTAVCRRYAPDYIETTGSLKP